MKVEKKAIKQPPQCEVVCSGCGRRVSRFARVCPNCGGEFERR